MKNIYLLGATGSIGSQVIDVVLKNKDKFKIIGFSSGHNIEKTEKIINIINPKIVSVIEKKDMLYLENKYPNIQFCYGKEGLITIAQFQKEDKNSVLVNSVVGNVGLLPTIKAIEIGRDILIANKETLVVAGDIIISKAKKHNVKLIPIDSEHSAIFQILQGSRKEDIKRIIITASGGSFRDRKREELENVTLEDALKHPSWTMGKKITIDSATMVNKALEVIEAHYLFDIDYDKISVIIHHQSIIHSMVEFNDGSIIAQMGSSDMRTPILYALNYPNKLDGNLDNRLNLLNNPQLTFEKLDYNKYPCFPMGLEAARKGGIMPLVFNTANEEANKMFINKKIKYLDIEKIIKSSLEKFNDKNIINPSLEQIMQIDQEIREYCKYSFEGGKNDK